jgi:glutathione S-transferase
MVRLRSTRNCVNTPRVLVGLEATDTPYEIEAVPDGTFTAEYGIPGPELRDGDLVVVEIGAVMRHVARAYGAGTLWPEGLAAQAAVDRWYELVRRISGAAGGDGAGARPLLERVDAQLAGKHWLVGEFTMADCAYVAVLPLRPRLPVAGLDRLVAYLDRLAALPAVVRGLARLPR